MVVATEAVVEYNVCLSTRQRESPSVLSLQTPSSPCPSFVIATIHVYVRHDVLQVTETGRSLLTCFLSRLVRQQECTRMATLFLCALLTKI